MLKKLQTISWGGWSALAGVVLFAGLAVYPLAAARLGSGESAHGKPKKDGLVAMLDKVAEKSAEAKTPKDGSSHKSSDAKPLEPKALAVLADGTLFVGTKHGLLRRHEDRLLPVEGLSGDVKGIALAADGTLLVATKMGAYRVAADASVSSLYSGDVHSVAAQGETLYLGVKHEGVLASTDAGRTWNSLGLSLPSEPAKAMKDGKEMKDDDKKDEKEMKTAKAKPAPSSATLASATR